MNLLFNTFTVPFKNKKPDNFLIIRLYLHLKVAGAGLEPTTFGL